MNLLGELKRRNVFRVAMLYVVAAWLVIEVAETVLPIFDVPDGVLRGLVVLLVIGLVPALGFAWIYELTPEGLKRDTGVTDNPEFSSATGHRLNWATLVVAVLAISFLAYDRFAPREPATEPGAAIEPVVAPSAPAAPASAGEPVAVRISEPARDPRPSVAVLPFANLSTDSEQEFFADGMTEDILTRLAGVSGLRVISRTSVMRYKNTELSLPEIAAQLGVSHVLEGSVRRAGDRVRITGQLIRAADDAHLWADSFDRDLADIFSVQTEIAGRIVEQLELQLTERDREALARQGTTNPEAYEQVLRGRAIARGSYSSFEEILAIIDEAEKHFRAAIALDENYADAWAGIAGVNRSKANIAEDETAALAAWNEATEAARRAIRLAPDSAAGYVELGQAYWMRGLTEAALEQLQLAAEIEPDSPQVLLAQGSLLAGRGQLVAALERAERVMQLEPEDPNAWDAAAGLYEELGEYEAARQAYRMAWEKLTPHEARLNCMLMGVALRENNVERARAHMARFLELESHSPFASSCALNFHLDQRELPAARAIVERRSEFFLARAPMRGAIVTALSGEQDTAEEFLRAVEAQLELPVPRGSEGGRLFARARIAVLRGEPESALDLLERAIEAGYWPSVDSMARHVEWDSVQDDPRFQQILARLNAELERMRVEFEARQVDRR